MVSKAILGLKLMDPEHTKEYGVYHWDTFDNETLFLKDFETLDEARDYIKDKYGERLDPSGADKIEVVTLEGNVVVSKWTK